MMPIFITQPVVLSGLLILVEYVGPRPPESY